MTSLSLSARQVKEADRVGGIELMVLYPQSLGASPTLHDDHEQEADAAERSFAEGLLTEECRKHGLVPVHIRVASVRRPKELGGNGHCQVHLAITLIGRRWVHARTQRAPRVMFATS